MVLTGSALNQPGTGIPRLHVDLSRPATERWSCLAPHVEGARRLLDCYVRDLGGLASFAPLIEPYAQAFVSAEHREEMRSIARIIGRPELEVLLGNLYYEAFRQLIGCTAFACDTPDGPLHARNLDWWTEDQMLARLTCVVRVEGAAAGPYELVSWPGFIGGLSGLAPGRFAVTLNAVISSERPSLAPPVVLLIRRALEICDTFAEAVRMLETSPVAADCLLLVTGTRAGEMVVIERTSTRAAVRGPERGFLIVTNDYRVLDAAGVMSGNRLQETACGRFDRATELLTQGVPSDPAACLRMLADPAVRMSITVQQMAMRPRTGELVVGIPHA
jgi:acid ceramidase